MFLDNFYAASILLAFLYFAQLANSERSFYIDFNNNTFVKDGVPFRYVSGSIHAYRIPKALWEDRLRKTWAAGLNAIQTYIYWNEHEPYPGVYDFEGQNDIFEFLELAQKIGFVVILRPGPYVCAEHDYGGLPWWLLSDGTDTIVPRSSEAQYMFAVQRWYKVLLPKLAPYLYNNGGPIITVQVENEYGSYYTCDKNYLSQLRDLTRAYLGDDVVLFTTDPPTEHGLACGTVSDAYATVDFGTGITAATAFSFQRNFAKQGPLVNGDGVGYLVCGAIQGAYSTVDFGVGANVTAAFEAQRAYAPFGPLVNSEFYPGWLDFWGAPHSKVDTQYVISAFNNIMEFNANINFYMFHGGTNFGYSNGADPPYLVQPTSYDYDAPLSEAGDITNKYIAVREAVSKYLPLPPDPIPANSTKISLGKIAMTYHVPLVDAITDLSDKCIQSLNPLSFEKLGQGYGFILYSTKLNDPNVFGKVLSVPGIRDRGYVQIGSNSVGVLYRNAQTQLLIKLRNNTDTSLYIIVENMGRLNFGNDMLDAKGILSEVTLGGQVITNWTACLTNNFIPNFQQKLNSDSFIQKYKRPENLISHKAKFEDVDYSAPAIYIGEFFGICDSCDTFLKMDRFTKGIALTSSNDTLTNIGRYWPNTGPQVTLYTPGVFTTERALNNIVLVEFEGSSCKLSEFCYVEFIDYPLIDSLKSGLEIPARKKLN